MYRPPADFVSEIILHKFPGLNTTGYKLMIPFRLFEKDKLTLVEVEISIQKMKTLLLHAIIKNQENNWMLITQEEIYFHNQQIDDVPEGVPISCTLTKYK